MLIKDFIRTLTNTATSQDLMMTVQTPAVPSDFLKQKDHLT